MRMAENQMFGPYQIMRCIGEGGFSAVFKAYDHELRRYVALKLIHSHIVFQGASRQRFRREIEAARRLRHPHIVKVYRAGFYRDRAFVSMKYIDAGTLEQQLLSGIRLGPTQSARVVRHIAGALDHAHGQGIIHRDVKTSNVLLDGSGRSYLCDFGLVKIRGMATVTRDSDIMGTVLYMSPEQVRGLKRMTPASDIYSLGVLLFELVAHRLPFDRSTRAGILQAIVHSPPPSPRDFNPSVSANVEKVLLRALAKDPRKRYQTAGQLAAAYQQALDSDGRFVSTPAKKTTAQPEKRSARPKSPSVKQSDHIWLIAIGLTALFLLILFLSS